MTSFPPVAIVFFVVATLASPDPPKLPSPASTPDVVMSPTVGELAPFATVIGSE